MTETHRQDEAPTSDPPTSPAPTPAATSTTTAAEAPAPGGAPAERVAYQTGGLRLVLLVLGGLVVGLLGGWWLLGMILGIGLMIFLHELGHFVTAKWSGMKVTQFFIGFGPRIWSFQRGETEYGVKVLPVGAYVRIIGMNNLDEVDPADEARTYRQQSFPKRLLVVSAGSLAHFAQAFVLLVVLLGVVGVPGGSLTRAPSGGAAGFDIASVSADSPAREAGLRQGDRVVALDGEDVSRFDDLPAAISAHDVGDTIELTVKRAGDTRTLAATLGPRPEGIGGTPGSTFLGVVSRAFYPDKSLGVGGAIVAAPGETARFLGQSVTALAGVFSPNGLGDMTDNVTNARSDRAARDSGEQPSAATSDREQHRLLSIVGVVRLGAQIGEQEGPALLLFLFFEMNIFIGLFNMLPLPPLDGGHAAVAVYERVRTRPGRRYHADFTKLLPLTYAVVMGLVVLFVATLYLDFVNPISLNG